MLLVPHGFTYFLFTGDLLQDSKKWAISLAGYTLCLPICGRMDEVAILGCKKTFESQGFLNIG